MRKIVKTGVLLCLFFMLIFNGFGQTKASLSQEKKKLEQEIAEQKKILATTQKNKNLSLREIQVIKNQISNQEKLIANINAEIGELDGEIAKNEQEIAQLNEKLEQLKADYREAVYTAYKYRNITNKVGVILSSESISQALTRANYLVHYASALKSQVHLISKTQEDIQKHKETLQQNKEEKSLLAQNKLSEKEQLARQEKEKQNIVNKLKKKEHDINAAIQKKIKRQKNIDAAIQKIINDEIAKAKAAAAKKAAASSSTAGKTPATTTTPKSSSVALSLTPQETALAQDFESNRGKLPWPVEKGNIVTKFGAYSHPEVSSVQLNNNGINILTEKGATVRAVFKGKVAAIADVNGAKAVILKHGNYFTVYTNLASVSVHQGDNVNTKQALGRLIQESNDSYSELHFEILKEKVYQNPSLWILK